MKIKLLLILLILGLAVPLHASDTGAISPGTVSYDASIGEIAWGGLEYVSVSDNYYASDIDALDGDIYDYSVKIIKGGAISGDNQAVPTFLEYSDTYMVYGGATSLWGLTWTRADIIASNFGVAFSVTGLMVTYYITATNFGFTIPDGSTINGIKAEVECKQSVEYYAFVDHIRVTIYYTAGTPTPTPTPSGPTNLKAWNGVTKASLKSIDGVLIGVLKAWDGVM